MVDEQQDWVRSVAKIEKTFLGFEDHGILTGILHVTYGNSSQGVGGYAIATVAGDYIGHTLKACGVRSWEELQGRTIYVLSDVNYRPMAIENLPTEKGERFTFTDVFHD